MLQRTNLLLLVLAALSWSCQPSETPAPEVDYSSMSEAQLDSVAQELAHKYIITDGHVDLPYRLQVSNFRLTKEFIGIPVETDEGDFDYVRAQEGGLDAPFMSIYIPASKGTGQEAYDFADELITMVKGIADSIPDKFQVVTSPGEVEANFEKGTISLPMGMENGSPIMDDLANVQYWHDRGIRYITLTHSKDNQICDSSYDTTGTWNGLSPFGREVVAEMNRVGIMVDISHVSDSTFYQVMELTEVPVIASHSSCRKFTPGFERNMSDDMIKRLGENGGVIQINFGSTFLDGNIADERNRQRDELRSLLEEKGLSANDEGAEEVIEQYRQENPSLYSDVEMVANHIDNVVELAGIDHVGLGSDFDGVGDSLPTGLKDVSQYPNLIKELLKRGYSEEDIAKICYKNVFRVWQAVEDHAKNI
ncbi:MAG TPA: dipeptidase [Saprospiraceae bacterium]|nr:dipeptidase [Saprospiraceae bacterium]